MTNPFRNKIIQIVSVNPWFDRFILFVILVNCLFLALDKEVDIVTKNIEVIDFIFLIIYTWEMTMKIIAMGFFMRAHSYLRDSWNIVSISIYLSNSFFCRWISVLSFSVGSVQLSTAKIFQLLRLLEFYVLLEPSIRSPTWVPLLQPYWTHFQSCLMSWSCFSLCLLCLEL